MIRSRTIETHPRSHKEFRWKIVGNSFEREIRMENNKSNIMLSTLLQVAVFQRVKSF